MRLATRTFLIRSSCVSRSVAPLLNRRKPKSFVYISVASVLQVEDPDCQVHCCDLVLVGRLGLFVAARAFVRTAV